MHRIMPTVALILAAGHTNAQVLDWANPIGGGWSDPANWSPANIPDAAGETARVALGGSYDVSLSAPGVSIGSLLVPNPHARVLVGPGATLGLAGPVNNTGRILVSGGTLHATGEVSIAGAGGLVLGGGDTSLTADPGGRFVIENGARIAGGGTILAPIEIRGSLRAEDPTTPLVLTGAPKRIDGFIFVEEDCTIEMRDTEIDLTDGGLTTYFGEVVCSDVTITGGIFDIVLDARLIITGDTTMSGTTTLGGLRVEPGARLTLRDAPENSGHMVVNPDKSAQPAEIRIENPHESIHGIGQITLAAPGQQSRIVGEPFIITGQQRLGGIGHVGAPLTCFGQIVPGVGAREIGTLTAGEPIEMGHPGSMIRLDVAGQDESDRLDSTSSFVAAGTMLVELAGGLTAADDWSATVVHADGGVTGRFFQVLGPISPDPLRVIRARYTANDVIVGSACLADMNMSGSLDFFDVAEFISLYNLQVRDADLAPPLNVWNFFDVAAYVDAYTAGCP